MSDLNADFHDLLVCLNDSDVEFLVVGAHALSWHGVPRATGDLDILVKPTPENARKVYVALARFGAPLRQLGISEETLSTAGMVCQFGVPPRRIDILTALSGVSIADAWSESIPGRFGSLPVRILGRDSLIRNKRATGRPKDLWDVAALESKDQPPKPP